MTFEYFCQRCTIITEHWAGIGKAPHTVKCTMCGDEAQRQYSIPQFIGTKVESPEYNPAFGQVVRNSQHRKELAKRRGMIEVGHEPVEKLQKSQDAHIEAISKKDYE